MIARFRLTDRRARTFLAAVLCLLVALGGVRLGFSGDAQADHAPYVRPGSAGPFLRHSPTRRKAGHRRDHGRNHRGRRHAGRRTGARRTVHGNRTGGAPTGPNWISAWGASPQAPIAGNLSRRGFSNQTIRQIVYTSIGGSEARIQLSNVFGSKPLYVGVAALGAAGQDGDIDGGNHVLRFNGKTAVTIPAGAAVLSDPVKMPVRPLERLAVSLYLPHRTGSVTEHDLAAETNYVASGDHAGQTSNAAFNHQTKSWYIADRIDVVAPSRDIGSVVALGDSITDGVFSTLNGNDRWPNLLARRFNDSGGKVLSVIDEGIGGNRILNNSPCCGENAVARFQRDVGSQPGVKEVILLEGVNDISYSLHTGAATAPHTDVSAAQIIAGDEQIIAQAHADGLKIFGATITPFQGARYWSPAGEAKRDAVNNWIETSGAFDGVIDFAKVLADPTNPDEMNPVLNAGDHLHPNPLGYAAMAASVNIGVLVHDA